MAKDERQVVVYKSVRPALTLSRFVDKKPARIQFVPHDDGHGEYATDDPSTQAWLESHQYFKTGQIRRGKLWEVKKAELLAAHEAEHKSLGAKITALKKA